MKPNTHDEFKNTDTLTGGKGNSLLKLIILEKQKCYGQLKHTNENI